MESDVWGEAEALGEVGEDGGVIFWGDLRWEKREEVEGTDLLG